MSGHSVFFEGLARFVAAGNRLTVVMGNYDVELFWPGVQRRFRELLKVEELATVSADGDSLESNIEFAPWIYYDREHALYAEHGNQSEALNSFRYGLFPVLPKKKIEINLPVGSLFVRYLLNQIEQINPFVGNIKPNTKYVAWTIKSNPLGFRHQLRLLGQFILALAKSYRKTGKLAKHGASDLIKFREETDDCVKRIAALFIVSVLALGFTSVMSAISAENVRAANEIGRILNESGNPVRYITFGHTHEPEILKTEHDTLHVNAGMWGVIFNDQEELIREKKQFAVMVIDKPGQEPRLVRWSDGIGSLEPLPLFDLH